MILAFIIFLIWTVAVVFWAITMLAVKGAFLVFRCLFFMPLKLFRIFGG